MNPDLEKLLELQQVDREIGRLKDEVAALPRRVAVIEHKLADSKAQVEKAKAAIKADEAARRKHESDIQSQQQKISKYREQSLDVKTNEQYKALMHEIEFAEQEIRICEDRILEIMLDAELREKQLKTADAEMKAETAEIEKEKAEVRARTSEDEEQLKKWVSRQQELRAGISPDVLPHYDRVSKLRGSAISEARDHKCAACNVMLRPQVFNDTLSNDKILTCDSCGRILYNDPARETPAVGQRSAPAEENATADLAAPQ